MQEVYAAIEGAPAVLALEITNHLLLVLPLLVQFNATQDESIYQDFWHGEEKLTLRWGRLIKPYRQQRFDVYFSQSGVLFEKGVMSVEEFSSLPSALEQSVSDAEMKEVSDSVSRFLGIMRDNLLMEQPPSPEAMEILSKDPAATAHFQSLIGGGASENEHHKSESRKEKGKDKDDGEEERGFGNTKTRSRLALYLLVKAAGVEPRADSAVSALAKLAHFITGEKLSTLNNSNTYKFYLQMPGYKTAKGRLEDLNFIRPFFEELGMNKALDLIDVEIVRANEELPKKARK
jgi:hypothetical protein